MGSEVAPLLGGGLVYSLQFSQLGGCPSSSTQTELPNLRVAPGPQHELDLDLAIRQAKDIFQGLFSDQEFLPRAPDPEEILLGDDKDGQEKAENKEHQGET